MDILEKLKNDIDDIKYIINHERQINKKNKIIKNLKITKNIIKICFPYIITPIITFESLAKMGHSPLIYDHIKENEKILKTIDSLGKITTINQYEKIKEEYNVIYHYHKWEFKDNEYQRVINKYYFDYRGFIKDINQSNDDIIDLLNNPNMLEKNYIIDSNQIMIETKNNLTSIDLKECEYFKIILYDENKDNFIIKDQEIPENLKDIGSYLLITVTIELLLKLILKKRYLKIEEENQKIIEEYQPIDIETIKKKLMIRKENLKRLTE